MTAGLARFTELNAADANIRGNPPERQFALRCASFVSPADAFRGWFRNQRVRVFGISRPICRLACIARHWDGLRILLDNGRVELDSDCVERRISLRIPSTGSPCEGRSKAFGFRATEHTRSPPD